MKIVEKRLPSGRFRVQLTTTGELTGHEIEALALKGMRQRPWPIRKVTPEEFYERHPPDENGNPVDTPVLQRGTPTMWFNQGPNIYLWPAPSADWTLQVTLKPREKANVDTLS